MTHLEGGLDRTTNGRECPSQRHQLALRIDTVGMASSRVPRCCQTSDSSSQPLGPHSIFSLCAGANGVALIERGDASWPVSARQCSMIKRTRNRIGICPSSNAPLRSPGRATTSSAGSASRDGALWHPIWLGRGRPHRRDEVIYEPGRESLDFALMRFTQRKGIPVPPLYAWQTITVTSPTSQDCNTPVLLCSRQAACSRRNGQPQGHAQAVRNTRETCNWPSWKP